MLRRLLPLLGLILAATAMSAAENLYEIPLKDIDGKPASLAKYKGRVLLIVNTASQCGYTPQYESLESVYEKYNAQGLSVLGFPCNQFGGQEPGSNAEIKQFCSTKFHVSFPMFDKIEVNGAQQSPLYAALTGKESPFPGKITWNFNKFLVDREGKIIARFPSGDEPNSPKVTKAIEAALAAK